MLNILGLAFSFLKKLHYLFYQYKRISSKLFFPASSFSFTKCTVHPVFLSFCNRTFWKVFNPLNLGKSEGWMFIIFFEKSE